MAVSVNLYNNAVKRLVNKEVTFTTLKLMLLDNTATFNAANSTLDSVAGALSGTRPKEVYGNGWTQGGMTLASVAVTVVTTNDAMLDADDVSVLASGGAIGPAYAAVLYDDTDGSKGPIAYIDFGQAQTAGQDTDFKVVWNVSGLFSFTY